MHNIVLYCSEMQMERRKDFCTVLIKYTVLILWLYNVHNMRSEEVMLSDCCLFWKEEKNIWTHNKTIYSCQKAYFLSPLVIAALGRLIAQHKYILLFMFEYSMYAIVSTSINKVSSLWYDLYRIDTLDNVHCIQYRAERADYGYSYRLLFSNPRLLTLYVLDPEMVCLLKRWLLRWKVTFLTDSGYLGYSWTLPLRKGSWATFS